MSMNPFEHKFDDHEMSPAESGDVDNGIHDTPAPNVNGRPDHEEHHPMSEETAVDAETTRVQKSDLELLEAAERRAKQLRAKLARKRDKDRVTLVADLYDKHGVKTIKGDLDESQRLAQLKAALGL